MAWIDASSVNLGCIGFSKTKSYWNRSLAACKKANSKAHLIEIFNDNQSKFLKSEKVRKQVRTHIGIDTGTARNWWIGAELKSGVWSWEHSKKQVTYWARIGGYAYIGQHPYGCMYLSKTKAYFHDTSSGHFSPICQIDHKKVAIGHKHQSQKNVKCE